jgi:hypothetical protein
MTASNMSRRARRMMKLWALLAAALVILHVLLFTAWIVIGAGASRALTPVVVVMVLYVALFAAIVVVFCLRVSRAADPVAYREAREHGLPATAHVLTIERTRWRVRRSRNFRLQPRPQRLEYLMRLRIRRDGVADYDADMAEYLAGDDVPEKGDVIAVKVHPRHPDVVVVSREAGGISPRDC